MQCTTEEKAHGRKLITDSGEATTNSPLKSLRFLLPTGGTEIRRMLGNFADETLQIRIVRTIN